MAYLHPRAGQTAELFVGGIELERHNERLSDEDAAAGVHRRTENPPLHDEAGAVIRDALDARLLVLMGGLKADLIAEGKAPLTLGQFEALPADFMTGAINDLEAGMALATHLLPERRADIEALIVEHGATHPRLLELAEALSTERVRGAFALMDNALVQAHRELSDHWPAVHAIADALLERDRLTGDEVRGIIARVEMRAREEPRSKFGGDEMNERLEKGRDRVAELVEAVQRAHAQRADATDEAERRAAEAELRLQREALEQARTDLARLEKDARCNAQDAFDRELREMAGRVLGDVDRVLSGALALHRAVSIAKGRGLRPGVDYAPVPDLAERALRGWRDRLRRISGERDAGRDYDDAA